MARDVEKTTPFTKDTKPGAPRPPDAPGPKRATAVGSSTPMFHNFDLAKKRKMPRWAVPLLTAMLLFHVVLFLTMWVQTIWDIEQLERPKNAVDLAIAPPPPPPPPPPNGRRRAHPPTPP